MKLPLLATIPALTALIVVMLVPMALAGESLYALSSNLNPRLLEVDPTTGAILNSYTITNVEALFGGLASDDAKDLYSIDGYNDPNPDRTFRIDRNSGAGTVVGPTGFNWNFRCVYVHPITDVLYASRDNELYTINKMTGAATSVVPISGPTLDQATAFAIDSKGNAYLTDIGGTGLFSLDLVTGQVTHIGDIGGTGGWFEDLAFDQNDVLYGARQLGGVYIIDTTNATQTLKFSLSFKGLAFVVTSVPCPGDFNCDGKRDFDDIDPFVEALNTGQCKCPEFANCDPNGDGKITFDDIDPFIAVLGVPCP